MFVVVVVVCVCVFERRKREEKYRQTEKAKKYRGLIYHKMKKMKNNN